MMPPVSPILLPFPPSPARYWKTWLPRGKKLPRVSLSDEGLRYRESVASALLQGGAGGPVAGTVFVSLLVFPPRPDDWRLRVRADPEGWDRELPFEGMDALQRVIFDALRGRLFEDAGKVRRIEAERAVPDGRPRVEVTVRPVVAAVHEEEEALHTEGPMSATAYLFPPGTLVATPSGRQAVVLRYLYGTGKMDSLERAICRYLDSRSDRECVTLQPRYLRRIG